MSALLRLHPTLPGLLPVSLIAIAALIGARLPGMAGHGLSALSLAILAGALIGNLKPALSHGTHEAGLHFAQRVLLRGGVALYGFNLDLGQIAAVGARGVGIDVVMVTTTLLLGLWLGTRVFGLDRDTALLTSAGSAICGAAAVVATVPILPDDGRQAARTAAAVATVLLFGTLAMLIYPLLYQFVGMGASPFGIYVGSTVHEVAQVVAIGNLLGDDVARNAVIVKMIRVMLLVPFLLTASAVLRRNGNARQGPGRITIPWFALGFIACAGLNSLECLPPGMVAALRLISLAGLAAAMAALGLGTTLARLRQTGSRVFVLGACLFGWLIIGGGLVNRLLNA